MYVLTIAEKRDESSVNNPACRKALLYPIQANMALHPPPVELQRKTESPSLSTWAAAGQHAKSACATSNPNLVP